MKNYPFSFDQLKAFSESNPYLNLSSHNEELYKFLKQKEKELNFPAVTDDIGNFLRFLSVIVDAKRIFEFGSGYGQSAFWYLQNEQVQKIYLCEKRDDLEAVFNSAPWPKSYIDKLDYFQGDAFERLSSVHNIDLFLIDGVKADYLRFLKECKSKLSASSLVVIDNSYWRGSFLDKELSENKKSAKNIKELHDFIKASKEWDAIFIPFVDGITVLRAIWDLNTLLKMYWSILYLLSIKYLHLSL